MRVRQCCLIKRRRNLEIDAPSAIQRKDCQEKVVLLQFGLQKIPMVSKQLSNNFQKSKDNIHLTALQKQKLKLIKLSFLMDNMRLTLFLIQAFFQQQNFQTKLMILKIFGSYMKQEPNVLANTSQRLKENSTKVNASIMLPIKTFIKS